MVLRFGTWNIRTLLQAGTMNSIVDEIIRYRMDMVALQEIRWKGKGDTKKKEFTMYFSGDENKQGQHGVGFIVLKKMKKSVLGFNPVSERICTLRIKGKFHNITFINIYAPTEDASEETVEQFYEDLQNICDKISMKS